MTKEEKNKINREIAKMLGFEFIESKPNKGIKFEQVKYPKDWKDEVYSLPVVSIPDFIGMINNERENYKRYGSTIPKDYIKNEKK